MGAGGRCGHPKSVGPATSQTVDTGGNPLQLGRRVQPPTVPGSKAAPPPGHATRLLPSRCCPKARNSRCPTCPPHPASPRGASPLLHPRRGRALGWTRGAGGGATWGVPGGSWCSARGGPFSQGWAGTERGPPPPRVSVPSPPAPCVRLPPHNVRPAAPGPLPAFEAPGGSPTPGPGPPAPRSRRCVPTRPLPPPPAPPPGARRREGGAAGAWRENDQGPRAGPERSARLMLPARRPRRTKAALRPRLRPPPRPPPRAGILARH